MARKPLSPDWSTSVDELVRIFRDALAVVAPVLQRAQIHSDDLRAYDDWDEIAQALFDNVIVRSIRASSEASDDINLGRYATLGSRPGNSPILVVRGRSGDEWKEFHSIVSRQSPFDTVEAIDNDRKTVAEIDYEQARFALRIPDANRLIETLTVEL